VYIRANDIVDVGTFIENYLTNVTSESLATGDSNQVLQQVGALGRLLEGTSGNSRLQSLLLSAINQTLGNGDLSQDVGELAAEALLAIYSSNDTDGTTIEQALAIAGNVMSQSFNLDETGGVLSDSIAQNIGAVAGRILENIEAHAIPTCIETQAKRAKGNDPNANKTFDYEKTKDDGQKVVKDIASKTIKNRVCGEDAVQVKNKAFDVKTKVTTGTDMKDKGIENDKSKVEISQEDTKGKGKTVVLYNATTDGTVNPSADNTTSLNLTAIDLECFEVTIITFAADLSPQNATAIASMIVDVTLTPGDYTNLTNPVRVTIPVDNPDVFLDIALNTSVPVCVYREDSLGEWSLDDSCAVDTVDDGTSSIACVCTHLSQFAVALVPNIPCVQPTTAIPVTTQVVPEEKVEESSDSSEPFPAYAIAVAVIAGLLLLAALGAAVFFLAKRKRNTDELEMSNYRPASTNAGGSVKGSVRGSPAPVAAAAVASAAPARNSLAVSESISSSELSESEGSSSPEDSAASSSGVYMD